MWVMMQVMVLCSQRHIGSLLTMGVLLQAVRCDQRHIALSSYPVGVEATCCAIQPESHRYSSHHVGVVAGHCAMQPEIHGVRWTASGAQQPGKQQRSQKRHL